MSVAAVATARFSARAPIRVMVVDDSVVVRGLVSRWLAEEGDFAVVASVRRTGRLLVVHEAVEVAGFGAEVVARVIERVGPSGVKAVKRLASPRIPIPFSPPLEGEVRVTAEKVVRAVKQLIG